MQQIQQINGDRFIFSPSPPSTKRPSVTTICQRKRKGVNQNPRLTLLLPDVYLSVYTGDDT